MRAIFITIASWVISSIIIRAVVGAGLTFAGYAGIVTVVDSLLDAVASGFGVLGDTAQVLYIAGVGEALSIVGGAIISTATLMAARIFLMRA